MSQLPGAERADSTRTAALRRGGLALMASLALLLAACGGGGGGGSGGPVDPGVDFEIISGDGGCGAGGCGGDGGGGGVGGSGGDGGGDGAGGGLGAMRNVIVTARRPDGTVLDSAALQDNLVSIYDRNYKGAFILEFADDGSGTGAYYDEATKVWTPLDGQRLRILVPRLLHHLSANPLTEAAYQWAIDKWGSEAALTAARMTEANDTVLAAANARVPAAFRVTDITNYAVAVSDATAANSLPNTNAGRYGTLLAGLPRAARIFAPGLASPALAFTRQLVQDVVDDGVINTSVPEDDQVAYGPELPALLADGIADARDEYAVPEQPAVAAAPNVCFNPATYFATGAVQSLNYEYSGPGSEGGGGTYTFTSDVLGQASFGGVTDAIEVRFSEDAFGVSQFFSPDFSEGLTSYGSSFSAGQGGTYTLVYTPPYTTRMFLLRPGESETLQIESTTTVTGTGQDPEPFFSSETQFTRFVGYETVTVPAGTFVNACKYEVQSSIDEGSTTETLWFTASGQGVLVKTSDSTGYVEVLMPGSTVNGQPVR